MSTCKKGYVLRKAYTRKYKKSEFTVRRKGTLYTVRPNGNPVHVPAACIKQRAKSSSLFGKLRKGDLIKYGYQYRLSDRLRYLALEKAMKAYGPLSLFHKLDAISKLSVKAPQAHAIFSKDREWVRAKIHQ